MTRRRVYWTAWLAIPAAWFLVFVLPWKLPQRQPVPSLSFAFGYNNAVAILGLGALLGVLLLAALRSRSAPQPAGMGPPDLFSGADCRLSTGLSATTAAVTMVTCLGVWIWWQVMPWAFFGETRYFLSRLDAMYTGLIPYRDFDFGYGPAMLYMPFWLHRLAGGMLPLDTAYILTVLIFWAVGFLILLRTLGFLNLTDSVRTAAVVLIGVAGFNLSLGVIYTPLRFLWAFHAVLWIHSLLRRRPAASPMAPALAAAIFLVCAGGFLLGPDAGMTTCLGVGILLAWSARCGRPGCALYLIFPALSALAVFAVFGRDYFKIVFAFGGGALNFPIPPAPYILLLLAASLWILPQLAASALSGLIGLRPVWAASTFCLGMGIPAALGRCDPGHVFWNGLPLFLVAGGAAWLSARPWLRIASAAGAAVLAATLLVSSWNGYGSIALEQLHSRRNIAAARGGLTAQTADAVGRLQALGQYRPYPWAKWFPFNPALLELLPYQKIGTPLGSSEDIEKFLKISGRYVSEYFIPPFGGIFSLSDLDKKLQALEGVPVLMIPRESVSILEKVDLEVCSEKSSELLSRLYVFPVRWHVLRRPLDPEAIIICYILKNYRVALDRGEDLIMERIPHE